MSLQLQTTQLNQSKPMRFMALGPTATRVVIISVFALLLLLYLAQSTQGATRQYQVRSLEENLATVTHEREALELESIRLQSLAAIAPAPEMDKDQPPKETVNADVSVPALSPAGQITAVTQE